MNLMNNKAFEPSNLTLKEIKEIDKDNWFVYQGTPLYSYDEDNIGIDLMLSDEGFELQTNKFDGTYWCLTNVIDVDKEIDNLEKEEDLELYMKSYMKSVKEEN